MSKEIEFLMDLQNKLKEQSKNNRDSQAHPRFWCVGDYKWIQVSEDCGSRQVIYSPAQNYVTPILEILDHIQEDFPKGEFTDGNISKLISATEEGEADEILDWCKKFYDADARLVDEKEEHYIVPSTFFITKEEAKAHIQANQHNYSKKAHTYAMTALRAPQVKTLWDILVNFNWNNLKEI